MPVDFVRLYDLRDQHVLISHMQEASLTHPDLGLAPNPLVGSDEWWNAVESGALERKVAEGTVTEVYWGSMADWPEFAMEDAEGERTAWAREGDVRRYVEGLAARVEFVEHPWKRPDGVLGTHSQVEVGLWVEKSDLRSAGIAPGPGEVGYQFVLEQHGEATHYLLVPERVRAEQLATELQSRGARIWAGGTVDYWIVQVWSKDRERVEAEVHELADLAQRFGGGYDGGEIVNGEVWGPRHP